MIVINGKVAFILVLVDCGCSVAVEWLVSRNPKCQTTYATKYAAFEGKLPLYFIQYVYVMLHFHSTLAMYNRSTIMIYVGSVKVNHLSPLHVIIRCRIKSWKYVASCLAWMLQSTLAQFMFKHTLFHCFRWLWVWTLSVKMPDHGLFKHFKTKL